MSVVLLIKYLDNYKLQEWGRVRYAKPGDACFDLRAAIDKEVCIPFTERQLVPLGIKVAVPIGYKLCIYPRSGLGANGFTLSNCVGIIDSGYRGEIHAPLVNLNKSYWVIKPGDRIVQAELVPVIYPEFKMVDDLPSSERGEGGFGHTGVN